MSTSISSLVKDVHQHQSGNGGPRVVTKKINLSTTKPSTTSKPKEKKNKLKMPVLEFSLDSSGNVSKIDEKGHPNVTKVQTAKQSGNEAGNQNISNRETYKPPSTYKGDTNQQHHPDTSNQPTATSTTNKNISKLTESGEKENPVKTNKPPNLLTVENQQQTPNNHNNSSGEHSPVSPMNQKSPSIVGSFGLIQHDENIESEDEDIIQNKNTKIKNISPENTNNINIDNSNIRTDGESPYLNYSKKTDSITTPSQEEKETNSANSTRMQQGVDSKKKVDGLVSRNPTQPSTHATLWYPPPKEVSKKSQQNFAQKAEHHSRAVHRTNSGEDSKPKAAAHIDSIQDHANNHINSKGLRPPPTIPKLSKESLSRPDTPELLDDNGDPLYAPVVKTKKSASRDSSSKQPHSGKVGTGCQEGDPDVFVQTADLVDENGNPLYTPFVKTKKRISRGASILSDSGFSSEDSPDAFTDEPIYALPEVSPSQQRKFQPYDPYEPVVNYTNGIPSISSDINSAQDIEDPYSSIDDNFKTQQGLRESSEMSHSDDLLSSITDSLQRKKIYMDRSILTQEKPHKQQKDLEDPYTSIDKKTSKTESTVSVKANLVEDPYSLVSDHLQNQAVVESPSSPYATVENDLWQQNEDVIEDPYTTVFDNISQHEQLSNDQGPYSLVDNQDLPKENKTVDDPYATIGYKLKNEDNKSDYEDIDEFEGRKGIKEPIYSNIQESRDRSKTTPTTLLLKEPATRSNSTGSLSPHSGGSPGTPALDSPLTRRSPIPSPIFNRPPMPTPETAKRNQGSVGFTPVTSIMSSISHHEDLDIVDGPALTHSKGKDPTGATPYKYAPRPSPISSKHNHQTNNARTEKRQNNHPSPKLSGGGESHKTKETGRMFTYASPPNDGVILQVQASPTIIETQIAGSPIRITVEKSESSDYRGIIPENSTVSEVQIEKITPDDLEYQTPKSDSREKEKRKLRHFLKKSNSPQIRRHNNTHDEANGHLRDPHQNIMRHDRHMKAKSEMFFNHQDYPEQPAMPRGGWFHGNTEIRNSWAPEERQYLNNNGNGPYPLPEKGYNRYSAIDPYQNLDGHKTSPYRMREGEIPQSGGGKNKLWRTRSDHAETAVPKKKEHSSNKVLGFFRAAKKTIRRSKTTDPVRGGHHESQKRQEIFQRKIADI